MYFNLADFIAISVVACCIIVYFKFYSIFFRFLIYRIFILIYIMDSYCFYTVVYLGFYKWEAWLVCLVIYKSYALSLIWAETSSDTSLRLSIVRAWFESLFLSNLYIFGLSGFCECNKSYNLSIISFTLFFHSPLSSTVFLCLLISSYIAQLI